MCPTVNLSKVLLINQSTHEINKYKIKKIHLSSTELIFIFDRKFTG